MNNYVSWALLGMLGYSATTLFMKLANKDGRFSSFVILAVAVSIVFISVVTITYLKGDYKSITAQNIKSKAFAWSIATGIVLATAVISLFKALSLGPASVVVPVYGMFVVGGALLGMIFLHEPVSLTKVLGILLAVGGIFLITR
ncbi:MAG: EamA family transporter [Agriterribacter sp.]